MKRLTLIVLAAMMTLSAMAIEVKRTEPISWWVGMKHPLQLMFYGTDLSGATVTVDSPDIKIKALHVADSPNYLFADVAIAPTTKPGTYTFTIAKGKKSVKVPYLIAAREEGSADRESFTSKDVVYLMMPDRFAVGELPAGLPKIEGKVDRTDKDARHGGNLQGMIDKLPYLADLGVTAVWNTPLTEDIEDCSYHGYAASDYYLIDPRYGTNELYKKYVAEAKKLGIKVIHDLVPNHCGIRHWWMKDLPFKDWINNEGKYIQTRYPQTVQLDTHGSQADFIDNRDYWFVESMPDMNLRNEYVLNYLAQNAIWWAEYAGLGGFRVDTYPYNDKYAAAEWTKRILEEYPNLNIVAECWVNEPSFVSYWEGAAKNKDGYSSNLPSVMDFPLQQRINSAISKQGEPGWAEGAQAIYFILAQDFLYTDPNTLLIFAENHDTDRLAHNTNSDPRKQMLVYSLLATMRGIPQIYYGSEQMFRGDQRGGHGGQRIDFPGGWAGDERDLFSGKGRTPREDSVYQHVRKLLNWRKTADAVHTGKLVHFFPDTRENMYVYGRQNDNKLVFVVLNFANAERELQWDKYKELFVGVKPTGKDVVSGRTMEVGAPVTLQPYESLIVEFDRIPTRKPVNRH